MHSFGTFCTGTRIKKQHSLSRLVVSIETRSRFEGIIPKTAHVMPHFGIEIEWL